MVSLVVISKVDSSALPVHADGFWWRGGSLQVSLKPEGTETPLKSVAWRSRGCSLTEKSMLGRRVELCISKILFLKFTDEVSLSRERSREKVKRPGMHCWCLALHLARTSRVGSDHFHLTQLSESPLLRPETALRIPSTCHRYLGCFGIEEGDWEGWEL